jgi:hypothetical protein
MDGQIIATAGIAPVQPIMSFWRTAILLLAFMTGRITPQGNPVVLNDLTFFQQVQSPLGLLDQDLIGPGKTSGQIARKLPLDQIITTRDQQNQDEHRIHGLIPNLADAYLCM